MADFNTMNTEGVNFAAIYGINATATPEYPGAPFAVGTAVKGSLGSEYVFCSNTTTAALVAGDVVQITNAFAASQITTATAKFGSQVGVVPVAVTQSTSTTTYYFWAQVRGVGSVNVIASAAANAKLSTTATVGRLSDATTTGQVKITGITLQTANTGVAGATANATIANPIVDAAY